ncbi:MAG: hypothetical protein CMF49_00580 [Legionellales bacterium]|nr:hypothetical protein [Legionellales bacterium]
MIKMVVSILLASLFVLLFEPYLIILLEWLTTLQHEIYRLLEVVFSSGKIGTILRNLVTMLVIPLIAVGLPSLIYYLIYRKKMPYVNEAIWGVWIVIATIIILNKLIVY